MYHHLLWLHQNMYKVILIMFRRLTHHLRCRPKWHMKSYYYSPQGKKSIHRPYMNIQCVAFSASVKKKPWPLTSLRKDVSPHVRESKKVLDSGFSLVDSGFQVWNKFRNPDSLSVEFDFRRESGYSLSCTKGFQNTQHYGFHKQKFGFRISG